jgi:pimeloyl-ACP methyl ester carboxylesterase
MTARRLLGLAAAAVALLAANVPAASAKPTVVLVHGAWADASGWNGEIQRLQRLGYPVVAPANPLRGLTSDAANLRSVLTTLQGPVVLVGHSYGGAVITDAAAGLPQVKALVYVAAFVPDEGEPVGKLAALHPGSRIGPKALVARPLPGDAGADLYLTRTAFRTAFAQDVPRATADALWAGQRPLAASAFGFPSGPPAWRTVRSWYLVATADRTIPPATQRFMARRAGSTVIQVEASHAAMVSQPAAVTKLIERAARTVGP